MNNEPREHLDGTLEWSVDSGHDDELNRHYRLFVYAEPGGGEVEIRDCPVTTASETARPLDGMHAETIQLVLPVRRARWLLCILQDAIATAEKQVAS
jgi:hypothetical protein